MKTFTVAVKILTPEECKDFVRTLQCDMVMEVWIRSHDTGV